MKTTPRKRYKGQRERISPQSRAKNDARVKLNYSDGSAGKRTGGNEVWIQTTDCMAFTTEEARDFALKILAAVLEAEDAAILNPILNKEYWDAEPERIAAYEARVVAKAKAKAEVEVLKTFGK